MKKSSLLLTTALLPIILLGGCNDKNSDIGWFDALKAFVTGKIPQEYLMDDLSVSSHDILGMREVEKTPTGSYLIGRYAQSNFDWETASKYFGETLAYHPGDIDLQKRSMALAMGAGDFDLAIQQARKITQSGEPSSLPQLFVALADFKSGDYDQVLLDVKKIPDDGISQFIKPLMKGWAAAGEKKTDITDLNKNVVHFYHAILIADYLNDTTALKILAQRDYSKLGLSLKSLKQIQEIFERHGLTLQAQAVMKDLPATVKDTGDTPLETVKDPTQGMAHALFDMASILYQDYPDSARLFAQMSLYLEPGQMDSRILMAQMAAQFKHYDEAISIFNGIDASKNPALAIKLKRQIAELLQKSGKTDQAIKILKEIVSDTKDVEAQIQIGDIYREEENFKDALSEYNKASDMLDGNVTVKYWNLLYARGIANERLKKWKDAERDLQSALALEPDQPYVLNYLGYSWTDQGINLEEATRMIEKAARLRPDDGYIVDSLGWVYYRQGQYDKAVQSLDRAVELSPYDTTINDHLGDAYWQVGRKNEARFQWQRALSFNPDADDAAKIQVKIDNGLSANAKPAEPNTAQIGKASSQE